jgi:hypothetical protein
VRRDGRATSRSDRFSGGGFGAASIDLIAQPLLAAFTRETSTLVDAVALSRLLDTERAPAAFCALRLAPAPSAAVSPFRVARGGMGTLVGGARAASRSRDGPLRFGRSRHRTERPRRRRGAPAAWRPAP